MGKLHWGTQKETIAYGAYIAWETIKGGFTVAASVSGATYVAYYATKRQKEDIEKGNRYLEDQLNKIASKEPPYDALTDEYLEEFQQGFLNKIEEGVNEITELDKQNINEIGFLHSDILTGSKFEIDESDTLKSTHLDRLQYVTAEWVPAFLRQAREFLFFLPPREASK